MNRKSLFILALTLASGILVGITGTIGLNHLKGVNGNVVHAHVVLHRMVGVDGGIHGVPPVKDHGEFFPGRTGCFPVDAFQVVESDCSGDADGSAGGDDL